MINTEYYPSKSCEEIAEEFGVTRQRIYTILNNSVLKVYQQIRDLQNNETSYHNSFLIMLHFFGVTCEEDINMVLRMLPKNIQNKIKKDVILWKK